MGVFVDAGSSVGVLVGLSVFVGSAIAWVLPGEGEGSIGMTMFPQAGNYELINTISRIRALPLIALFFSKCFFI